MKKVISPWFNRSDRTISFVFLNIGINSLTKLGLDLKSPFTVYRSNWIRT